MEDSKVKGRRDIERCDEPMPWMTVLEQALGEGWAADFAVREGFESLGPKLGGGSRELMTVREAEQTCLTIPGCVGFDVVSSGLADPDDDERPHDARRVLPQFVGRGRLRPKMGSRAHVAGSRRHMDAVRCVQWSLGWSVPAFQGLRGDPDDEEERGVQGCISALFRRGLLQMLGGAANDTSDTVEGWPEGQPELGWSGSVAWTPRLCEVIAVRLPGWDCRVTAHGVEDFARHLGAPLAEGIARSLRMGPIEFFSPGAGRSGSSFAQTADGVFKVKMGLRQSQFGTVDEVQSLQHVILGNDGTGAPSLDEHFGTFPGSTLNKAYALLQLDFGGLGLSGSTNLILLQDGGYGLADADMAVGSGGAVQRYDLKGASRDQERTSGPGAFTWQNGDFAVHEGGRLELDAATCVRLHGHMEADMGFLDAHGLIDYSLFLTVFEDPSAEARELCVELGEPRCWQGLGGKMYALSLIDYLNDYALSKLLESYAHAAVGRGLRFHEYAAQLLHYLEQICPVPAEVRLVVHELQEATAFD